MPSCEDTRCGDYEQCAMIKGAPMCVCMPGFEETDQGCLPAQHGKIFFNIIEIDCMVKNCWYFGWQQRKLLLQYPVTKRITVRLMGFAVLTEIERSTFACVCPVTSVSKKLKKKSLPTVNLKKFWKYKKIYTKILWNMQISIHLYKYISHNWKIIFYRKLITKKFI